MERIQEKGTQFNVQSVKITFILFKGCVRYIYASLFLSLNESTCETRENAYFTSKALLVLEKIKF